MCGRIRQARQPAEYFESIFTDMSKVFNLEPGLRFNVPPGTTPMVIHELASTRLVERQFWGYAPAWYKYSPVSNSRLDKILDNSPFWRIPMTHRMIVPADGWFEWTGVKGNKQPWYIRPADHSPILMAAISGWQEDEAPGKHTGFAIVTDDAAGGMVDIHDRRPVVLTPEHAREWLDPDTTMEQAKQLLSLARPEASFEWYEVTRKVGNSRYQEEDSADPVTMDASSGNLKFE